MSDLIPKHGGYRKLKSFQVAQLVYDVTVRFCNKYINSRSRTHDQMVQAARSGVQNIAEGSQASATSKKIELKLTQVARASLEELKLDYEDFLRQHGLKQWERENPLRQDQGGEKKKYNENLETDSRYEYKVIGYTENGISSPDSNIVGFDYQVPIKKDQSEAGP